jgi:dCMP deaminase
MANTNSKKLKIPSWDELFMRHVYLIASKSKDPRTKIGAILVKDGIIISEGYNGFARNVKDKPSRYRVKEQKYPFMVHGEANAVLNTCRHGVNTTGSICYTQGIPCNECAKTLIQAGVTEVIVHRQWPAMNQKWLASIKTTKIMFKEAKVKIRVLNKKLNLTGINDGVVVKV